MFAVATASEMRVVEPDDDDDDGSDDGSDNELINEIDVDAALLDEEEIGGT